MKNLLNDTKRFCKIYNLRQENKELELCPITDTEEIEALYKTYNGPTEFLYIPSKEEITENINTPNCVYLGLRYKGKLIGQTKLSLLELPSSFFNPPKSEPIGDYYGVSGLLVREGSRGLRIAKRMVKCATILAKFNGGVGIYADFDYRNIDSMRVISKLFNFVGFADGRNGAVDEQTIYTTFYKPLTYNYERTKDIKIICKKLDCENAEKSLKDFMLQTGDYSTTKVEYGGQNHYNLLHCLDKVVPIKGFEIIEEQTADKNINKNF